jgi:hypothetical protein
VDWLIVVVVGAALIALVALGGRAVFRSYTQSQMVPPGAPIIDDHGFPIAGTPPAAPELAPDDERREEP